MNRDLFDDKPSYVMDTGFFITSRSYYPAIFSAFWEKMNEAVRSRTISSVKEVWRELEDYKGGRGEQEHLLDWLEKHKHIFAEPTHEEEEKVVEIFAVPKFQKLIDKRKIEKGGYAADPFLIAKAWDIGGIVVTEESPRSPVKIPAVCDHFGVKCITPEAFMQEEKWNF